MLLTNKPRLAACLTWMVGLVLSAGLCVWIHQANQQLMQSRHAQLTDEVAGLVTRKFGMYEYGLRGLRGAVVASGVESFSWTQFEAYNQSRDLAREFPGARGFGLIRRLAPADQARFVMQARANGAPDFTVRQLAPHEGDRFVIQYIHRTDSNRGAMGLDVASEVKRREAALAAAREGTVQLTAPITLVQSGDHPRRGFLAFLPIYGTAAPVHAPEARTASVVAWCYAPLLVDDVLASLGLQLQEIGIRLTDASETQAFFDSAQRDGAPALAGLPELSRELSLFGRRWVLQSRALEPLAAAARPTSLVWVGAGAVLASSLLALLVWQLLQARRGGLKDGAAIDGAAAEVTLWRFLGSPLARWAGLAYLCFLLVYAGLGYQFQWRLQMDEALRTLTGLADERAERLKAAQVSRRKTMLFLAETPPVQGLLRASATGIDPWDGSSRKAWESRMQQILRAHIKSSPEVYQARFISLAEGGREWVRVERRGQDVVAVSQESLQAKVDRTLMQQASRLAQGEVWISELDLNRENGQLEQPHRPTIRYATPVYRATGQVFGIIVVNVDVSERLKESLKSVPEGVELRVMNGAEDYLLHPDAGRAFGFDLGARYRWQDEFKPAALPAHVPAVDRLRTWAGPDGLVVSANALVSPNAGSSTGTLSYTASLPLQRLESAVWAALGQHLLLPLLAGSASWLLLYLYWGGVQRQLQVKGQRLRLATIVDQSLDAIIALDAQYRVRSWNQGAVQLFGLSEASALGQPLLTLIDAPVGAGPSLDADGATALSLSEFECRGQDGRRLRVCMRLSALAGGEYSASLRDVTSEREAQAQIEELNRTLEQQVQERTASLAQERQRLRNILLGTRVETWEWNVATGETVFNERWADIMGYRLDELMPLNIETWATLVHPDDLQASGALLQRHFAGLDEHYSIEVRMRHKDGSWVWVLSRGQLVTRKADGEPEWMYGTHQDINAIKHAELELKRLAALLAGVLRAATELSIIATDAQGMITLFNAGAEQLLGYQAEEMVGRSSPAPLHLPAEVVARGLELSSEYGVEISGFRVFVHKAELEGAEQREWTYVRKGGNTVPVSLVVTAIRDEQGSVVGYLGIAQDITDRLWNESVLRQAKVAAEAASAAKSMFLANMSHEIRTPMNAVIGVTHLLDSTPLDADQRQLLDKLHIAARSLLGIINDVLDLSKIEAGEMSVQAAPMNPRVLLNELAQIFGPQAQAKGIALELCGLDALPPVLMVDELRLRQILVNLISNAIKFTAQGGVSIEVEREPAAEDHGAPFLRWRVRDTGVGISVEAQGKLFDPFVQADASTTRRFGGTGLGLSIVRKLAGLMGGEVGLQSELGRGSEFYLRLPLVEAEEAHLAAQTRGSAGLDIVVVDDNPDDRRILAGMCRALGWSALELSSGVALVEYCKRIAALGQAAPDALLVDWQMPELDGLQALEMLVNEVGKARLPATLVISAQERSAVEAEDHHHLVDQILTKPVGPSELFNAVNHSVARHTGSTDRVARSTRTSAIDSQWLAGIHVLVVDDSDINLEVARRLLQRDGAIVQTANGGHDALALLRREPALFDAVLMDVQMPEMDGYEVTRLIRSELGLDRLPVLALTAGALEEERQRAVAAGMNDFLTKPLDPQILVRALRTAVEAARGAPLQLPRAVPARQLPPDWPDIAGVDGPDAANRLGQDAALFLRMLERLLREFGAARFSAADGSEAQGEELVARLHKLRGSAGLLGAREVHRLAGEAENALRAGAQPAAVHPTLLALKQGLQDLEQAARPVLLLHERAEQDALLREEAAPSPVAVAAPTAADLAQWLDLLRQQDLSAGPRFQELAPALEALWGRAPLRLVREAVQDLDFSGALRLIEQMSGPDPDGSDQAGV